MILSTQYNLLKKHYNKSIYYIQKSQKKQGILFLFSFPLFIDKPFTCIIMVSNPFPGGVPWKSL